MTEKEQCPACHEPLPPRKGYGCTQCLAPHPAGRYCDDCQYVAHCKALLGITGRETACDWIPSRFSLSFKAATADLREENDRLKREIERLKSGNEADSLEVPTHQLVATPGDHILVDGALRLLRAINRTADANDVRQLITAAPEDSTATPMQAFWRQGAVARSPLYCNNCGGGIWFPERGIVPFDGRFCGHDCSEEYQLKRTKYIMRRND